MIDSKKLLRELAKIKGNYVYLSMIFGWSKPFKVAIKIVDKVISLVIKLAAEEDNKPEHRTNYAIDTNLFDEEEIYDNCTVQVLHNSVTDEYSVGWWNNEKGAAE